jgi:hypothetical protein
LVSYRVIVELIASTGGRRALVDTSHLVYMTRCYWGQSYSIRVSNESYHAMVMAGGRVLEQAAVRLLKSMELRGLVLRARPKRTSRFMLWSLTDVGLAAARRLTSS